MSHHHTYYVTSSYILCHIIIHIMPNASTSTVQIARNFEMSFLSARMRMISRYPVHMCHTMSHHHTYYVTSSYILCHIIIHTMSHHHTYYVTSSYILSAGILLICVEWWNVLCVFLNAYEIWYVCMWDMICVEWSAGNLFRCVCECVLASMCEWVSECCVCACVRVRVRDCVCVCVRARARVYVCVYLGP